MTPCQCRAARALLNWTQTYLAEMSGVKKSAISSFERGDTDLNVQDKARLYTAVHIAGVRLMGNTGVAMIQNARKDGG